MKHSKSNNTKRHRNSCSENRKPSNRKDPKDRHPEVYRLAWEKTFPRKILFFGDSSERNTKDPPFASSLWDSCGCRLNTRVVIMQLLLLLLLPATTLWWRSFSRNDESIPFFSSSPPLATNETEHATTNTIATTATTFPPLLNRRVALVELKETGGCDRLHRHDEGMQQKAHEMEEWFRKHGGWLHPELHLVYKEDWGFGLQWTKNNVSDDSTAVTTMTQPSLSQDGVENPSKSHSLPLVGIDGEDVSDRSVNNNTIADRSVNNNTGADRAVCSVDQDDTQAENHTAPPRTMGPSSSHETFQVEGSALLHVPAALRITIPYARRVLEQDGVLPSVTENKQNPLDLSDSAILALFLWWQSLCPHRQDDEPRQEQLENEHSTADWSPYLAVLSAEHPDNNDSSKLRRVPLPVLATFSDEELTWLQDPWLVRHAKATQRERHQEWTVVGKHLERKLSFSSLPVTMNSSTAHHLGRLASCLSVIANDGELSWTTTGNNNDYYHQPTAIGTVAARNEFLYWYTVVTSHAIWLEDQLFLAPMADMINHAPRGRQPKGKQRTEETVQGQSTPVTPTLQTFADYHKLVPEQEKEKNESRNKNALGGEPFLRRRLVVLADRDYQIGDYVWEEYSSLDNSLYLDFFGFCPIDNPYHCHFLQEPHPRAQSSAAAAAPVCVGGFSLEENLDDDSKTSWIRHAAAVALASKPTTIEQDKALFHQLQQQKSLQQDDNILQRKLLALQFRMEDKKVLQKLVK